VLCDYQRDALVDVMLVLLIIFIITVPCLKEHKVGCRRRNNLPTVTKPEDVTIAWTSRARFTGTPGSGEPGRIEGRGCRSIAP